MRIVFGAILGMAGLVGVGLLLMASDGPPAPGRFTLAVIALVLLGGGFGSFLAFVSKSCEHEGEVTQILTNKDVVARFMVDDEATYVTLNRFLFEKLPAINDRIVVSIVNSGKPGKARSAEE